MATEETKQPEVIKSVKGFNRDMTCRGFKFEVGKTYAVDGPVVACANGFHACENPLDVFSYYAPATSVFHEVEQSGALSRHDEDSKIASAKITIGVEISFGEIVKRGIAWLVKKANTTIAVSGHAAAQGYRGHAAAQGDSGHAAAQGYSGHAAAQGKSGHAAAQGDSGHAAAQGFSGHAAAQGDSGHAAAQGFRGHAAAQGYSGHAAAQGKSGHAASQGDRGHAAAQGVRGHAETNGKHSIAVACGYAGRARAPETGAIMLACISSDDYSSILAVRASKVGENGIRPGVWYSLNESGEFVEVDGDAK